MAETFIFVYQTICETNGKSYVGVHKTTNLNDGYIGCGICRQDDARRDLLFHKAVRKYGYASFKRHILSFYDNYDDALEEEKYIVTPKWVLDKSNYNTAIGGHGNTTIWMDSEKKEAWKSSIKEGMQEWLENGGRELLANKIKNIKTKMPTGAGNHRFGKPASHRRKILYYNLQGEYLATFSSIKDASESTGVGKGNIVSCCKGNYKTTEKGLFRYEQYKVGEKESFEKTVNRICIGTRRGVVQINKIGEIVNEYISLVEAAKGVGCSRGLITKHMKRDIPTCKGFVFNYK